MRKTLVIAVGSLALLGATKAPPHDAPAAKQPYSAIYCQAGPHLQYSMFIGKELSDGRLQFYLSRWLGNGALTGTSGKAERESDHWVFEEPVDPSNPHRCRVRIWLRAGGVPDILPDKEAACEGGYNLPMGRVTFAKRDYYHRVTRELDPGYSPEEDGPCRGSRADRLNDAAAARQR